MALLSAIKSVISLTKFNTKWRSKRKLENPVSAKRKGTGFVVAFII